MGVKIKSKTVFSTYFTLSGFNADGLEEKTSVESLTLFNENGKVISLTKYLANGQTENMVKFQYDEKGNVIEELNFISETEISEKKTYRYDEKNLLVASFLHYLDQSFDTTIYIYDETGRLIEKRTMDSENLPESREEIHYSGDLCSQIVKFDMDGNILEKEEFSFDSNNKLLEKTVLDQLGDTERNLFYYDDFNRIIRSEKNSGEGLSETLNQYDPAGNLVNQKLFIKKKLLRNTDFEYDQNNLLKTVIEYFSVPGFSQEHKTVKKYEYGYF